GGGVLGDRPAPQLPQGQQNSAAERGQAQRAEAGAPYGRGLHHSATTSLRSKGSSALTLGSLSHSGNLASALRTKRVSTRSSATKSGSSLRRKAASPLTSVSFSALTISFVALG